MTLDIKEIQKKFKNNIYLNESLAKYSWFNLGGPAKILFKASNKEELIYFLKHLKKKRKNLLYRCRLKYINKRWWIQWYCN